MYFWFRNYDFQKMYFGIYKQEPKADSNSWSAVHKPETLTTDLWYYSAKSIDTNNLTKILNRHLLSCVSKSLSLDAVSYLKKKRSHFSKRNLEPYPMVRRPEVSSKFSRPKIHMKRPAVVAAQGYVKVLRHLADHLTMVPWPIVGRITLREHVCFSGTCWH